MKENYDTFFDELIKHEGGFTDDERDPGNQRGDGHGNRGSTNLGVTAKVWAEWTGKPAPIEVMKQLTKEDIKPMYKARYWDAVQGDHLPSGVDISVADFGVNAGPSRAAKRLQRLVMANQDGKIGPKTLSMVFNMEPATLLDKYADARESYYRSLKTFEIYGRGWLRRNDEVLEKAKSLMQ